MKVQTWAGNIYDVIVKKDGSWEFTWTAKDGVNTYTYSKETAHKNIVETQYWTIVADDDATPQQELAPHYAAAFNMWQDDFCNSPQAYEDSHSTAIRHLTEKLRGEEPSYGMICEQVLIEYLEKLK